MSQWIAIADLRLKKKDGQSETPPPRLKLRNLNYHLVMGRSKAHQALLVGYFRPDHHRNGMLCHDSKLSTVHDWAGGSMGGNSIPGSDVRLQMTSKVQEAWPVTLYFGLEDVSARCPSLLQSTVPTTSASFHLFLSAFVLDILKNSFIFLFLHFFGVFCYWNNRFWVLHSLGSVYVTESFPDFNFRLEPL